MVKGYHCTRHTSMRHSVVLKGNTQAGCTTFGEDTTADESNTHPAAHAILPQFGSCPNMAALVREEAAMDLAILAPALSSGAPRAVTSRRQVAPSPSHAIDFARP